MKKIEAIIRHEALAAVQMAVQGVGVRGMTVTGVRGVGRENCASGSFGGLGSARIFLPKLKLEILVSDTEVVRIAEQIADAARTGLPGDGRILVVSLETVICIRTSETAEAALGTVEQNQMPPDGGYVTN